MTSARRIVPFAIAFIGTLVADQVSKVALRASVDVGDAPRSLLPFLDLTHVHNRGIAFSLLSGGGLVLVALASLVVIGLVVFMWRAPDGDTITRVGAGMVAGGAVGNMIDRMRLGHVTDFLQLPNWPTFNVADIGITVGVVLIIYRQWRPVERAA